MTIITTWKTFLTYALDVMTKTDCAASVFFICSNAIRYDSGVYDKATSQIVPSKILWPDANMDEVLRDNSLYYKYLENVCSSPSANIGKLLEINMCLPTFILVPGIKRNTELVHVLQQFLYDVYGIGSFWLDGAIYDRDGNEYKQDDDKLRKKIIEHVKKANAVKTQTRSMPGRLYRDTRLNHLNSMNETDMRKYLRKQYDVDTSGMDASTVYAMMVDLYVDESAGVPESDDYKKAIREKYKESRKKV